MTKTFAILTLLIASGSLVVCAAADRGGGGAGYVGRFDNDENCHPMLGATHFLTKTLPKVATEMALSVPAYNLTRVMNIVGVKPLIAAIGA